MVQAIGVEKQYGDQIDYLSKIRKSKEAADRHAKAESERRQRINSHLYVLRKIFPHLPKKDKPRVLTEAVQQLRKLRATVTAELAQQQNGGVTQLFLPGENDEVAVVPFIEGGGRGEGGSMLAVNAIICCEDRPELNRELTEAVHSVNGRVVKAEMATVGGRTKVDVVVRWYCDQGGGDREKDLTSLRRALKAVVDNRSLGFSMLGRVLQADSWASLELGPSANRSSHLCAPTSIYIPDKVDVLNS